MTLDSVIPAYAESRKSFTWMPFTGMTAMGGV
jgi:hypothetical protein